MSTGRRVILDEHPDHDAIEGADRRHEYRSGVPTLALCYQMGESDAVSAIGSCSFGYGGGGNRTRVRDRTGESVYKHRPRLEFARRPVRDPPTAGLALLQCRASGEWLSFGAEPAR